MDHPSRDEAFFEVYDMLGAWCRRNGWCGRKLVDAAIHASAMVLVDIEMPELRDGPAALILVHQATDAAKAAAFEVIDVAFAIEGIAFTPVPDGSDSDG